MFKKVRCLVPAIALALATFTTTADAQKVFHRGIDGDPETLDTHKTQTVSEAHLLRDLSEGLVIHNAKGEVVPGAAESWTISDDGKVYTFKLRANGKWSNGDAVKAADFVFSLRRIMDPATGAKYANLLYPLKNGEKINKNQGLKPDELAVKAVDDRTLEITLERPTAYFLELLTHQTGLPVHPASVEKHGKDFVKPENWVSNGAYKLKENTPNAQIVVVKNTHFHDAANVKIDEVRFYPRSDLAAAARQFQAGELQFTTDIPADQVKFLREKLGNSKSPSRRISAPITLRSTHRRPRSATRGSAWRCRWRSIVSSSPSRSGPARCCRPIRFVPPGVGNYREPAALDFKAQSPIDREAKAKDLLKQAGFGPGGKPLKVQIRYNMTDNNKATVIAVADQWKAIGIETDFVSTDAKTHFAHLREGGDYDVARVGWIARLFRPAELSVPRPLRQQGPQLPQVQQPQV